MEAMTFEVKIAIDYGLNVAILHQILSYPGGNGDEVKTWSYAMLKQMLPFWNQDELTLAIGKLTANFPEYKRGVFLATT